VHKFDNFSWINYVLNGSLPNKNVIIRTRNGSEIESSVSISEIFLSGEGERYYIITLNNIRQLENSEQAKEVGLNTYDKRPIFKMENEITEPTVKIDNFTKTDDSAKDEVDARISFNFDKEDIKPAAVIVDTTTIDNATRSIFGEPSNNPTIEPIQQKSSNIVDAATIDNATRSIFGEPSNPPVQQHLSNSVPASKNADTIKINVQEISDLLGIGADDVIKYMHEYVSYLDENVGQLQELYKNGSTPQAKRIAINLIGIGSNLRAKEVVQSLQKLLAVGAGTHLISTLQEIDTVTAAFKQSVSKL
jgi:hypothetical protein